MKKFILTLIAVIMAISVTGCSTASRDEVTVEYLSEVISKEVTENTTPDEIFELLESIGLKKTDDIIVSTDPNETFRDSAVTYSSGNAMVAVQLDFDVEYDQNEKSSKILSHKSDKITVNGIKAVTVCRSELWNKRGEPDTDVSGSETYKKIYDAIPFGSSSSRVASVMADLGFESMYISQYYRNYSNGKCEFSVLLDDEYAGVSEYNIRYADVFYFGTQTNDQNQ